LYVVSILIPTPAVVEELEYVATINATISTSATALDLDPDQKPSLETARDIGL
jgi:hypothetical protein